MTDTATAPPATGADTPRPVSRRRSLPGGRAVVGAFLVTLAAVGIFTAWLQANATPSTTWVVAARDLLPGDVLTAADITTVPIDLPEAQANRTTNNPAAMVDRIVLSPLFEGELVGVGDTADANAVAGTSSLTFPVETSRALGGTLTSGDRVDVVATFEDSTRYVAVDLPVVEAVVDGTVTSVTLAATNPTTILAVANAVDTATVFLARTNPDGDATSTAPVVPDAEVLDPAAAADGATDTGDADGTGDADRPGGADSADGGN